MDIVENLKSYKRDRSGYAEYCHQAAEEIERLRADANRYRWLRDVGDATWRPFALRAGYSAEMADAAIDDAMAANA